jgi:hypothetical protein
LNKQNIYCNLRCAQARNCGIYIHALPFCLLSWTTLQGPLLKLVFCRLSAKTLHKCVGTVNPKIKRFDGRKFERFDNTTGLSNSNFVLLQIALQDRRALLTSYCTPLIIINCEVFQ